MAQVAGRFILEVSSRNCLSLLSIPWQDSHSHLHRSAINLHHFTPGHFAPHRVNKSQHIKKKKRENHSVHCSFFKHKHIILRNPYSSTRFHYSNIVIPENDGQVTNSWSCWWFGWFSKSTTGESIFREYLSLGASFDGSEWKIPLRYIDDFWGYHGVPLFQETSIYTGWWFGTFFIVPYIGKFIIPTDFCIFFRGVGRKTTKQIKIAHLNLAFDLCQAWACDPRFAKARKSHVLGGSSQSSRPALRGGNKLVKWIRKARKNSIFLGDVSKMLKQDIPSGNLT